MPHPFRRFMAYLIPLVLSLAAGQILAAVRLEIKDGMLISASGVVVKGMVYDVTFQDGSCVDLFDGCDENTDFPFATARLTRSAGLALLNDVLVDYFDSEPSRTRGCSDHLWGCIIFIPVALSQLDPRYVRTRYIGNSAGEAGDVVGSTNRYKRWRETEGLGLGHVTYSVWTPIGAVPEPRVRTLALVGAAALGLTVVRRRPQTSTKCTRQAVCLGHH